MKERLEQISKWLERTHICFSFIQSKTNVFYLSKVYCEPHERLVGIGMFPNKDPFFICPNMEVSIVRQSGWEHEIVSYSDSEDPWQLLKKAVNSRNLSLSTCALEQDMISYSRVKQIKKLFGEQIKLERIDDVLLQFRKHKTKEEQKILKEAASLADFGVEVGVHALQTGRTENEILAFIEFELKKKGIREMAFSTLVLSGENSARPHGKPGKREIKQGDFILFDLGVILDGYCSDITRTVAFQSISEEQEKIYHTVLTAQKEALAQCKAGTPIKQLDIRARSVISDAGYGQHFPHRIGHGLGIDVHEFPSLTDVNEHHLTEGMYFTIEPGIYVPELGGVRIEDDVLITKDGFEIFTTYPKELQIIT